MTIANLRHIPDLRNTGPRERLVAQPHEFINKRPLKAAAMEMATGAIEIETAKPNTWFWYVAPEVRKFPGNVQYEDPTGTKFGRMVVIGLLPEKGNSKKAMWLCRCSCGLYEGRSYRTIAKARPLDGVCHKCNKTLRDRKNLFRQNFHDKNGYWPCDAVVMRMYESWV